MSQAPNQQNGQEGRYECLIAFVAPGLMTTGAIHFAYVKSIEFPGSQMVRDLKEDKDLGERTIDPQRGGGSNPIHHARNQQAEDRRRARKSKRSSRYPRTE